MSFQTILFQHPQLFTLIGLKVDGLEICMSSNIWSCCGGSKKVSGLFSFLLFNHDMDWFETKRSKLLFLLFNNLCVLFWKYFLKNKSIHVEVLLLIGGVYKLLVIVQKRFFKIMFDIQYWLQLPSIR